jgi:hypothetical protein
MYLTQPLSLTAGAVHTGVNYIYALSLNAGVDAATLKIYDGTTAGGTLIWHLSAPATGSAQITFPFPLDVKHGIFVALTGTSPLAYAAVDYINSATFPSTSMSPSLSPSSSNSPSVSPSLSPSSSNSPSVSPSSSNSPSLSPSSSISPSNSPSLSPSASLSPSSSASPSSSVSPSISPSSSVSPSNSPSKSPSSSLSPSSSVSASVSPSI